MTGDGKLDLVAGNRNGNTVSVLWATATDVPGPDHSGRGREDATLWRRPI